MTRETHSSIAAYEAAHSLFRGPTVTHTAPTLAELWAKISGEVITQELRGLRVVQVSATISFEEKSK